MIRATNLLSPSPLAHTDLLQASETRLHNGTGLLTEPLQIVRVEVGISVIAIANISVIAIAKTEHIGGVDEVEASYVWGEFTGLE
jgi:hypothetical protein